MVSFLKKISIFITFLLLSCFFIKGTTAYSYDNDLKFKNITIEDGLSQSSVGVIFQDSKGYMWFGTSDGLNRYDGHEFKVYKYKLDDDNSITSNCIGAVIEDKDGFLWIGTSKGLNKLDTNTDKITRCVNDPNDPTGVSHYNVWDIMEDSKGYIWIATEKGLNKYDKKTDVFVKYYNDQEDDNSLSSNFITSLCEDNDGAIWIGTKNGLNRFDTSTNKFTRYLLNQPGDQYSIASTYISKVYKDNTGNIWVATQEGGLNKYDRQNNRFIKCLNDNKSIPSNFVQAIFEDSNGDLWIGSKGGLSQYNQYGDELTSYRNNYYDHQSLINNNVLCIYKDKSGMLWIGTYNGISILNPTSRFKHYKKNPIEKNSLNDNMLSGIYEDADGVLWVGTNSGGLNSINRKTGEVKHYLNNPKDEKSISNNTVWGITEDSSGDLWIATSCGLNRFNKKTENFTRYLHDSNSNSLINNEVRFVYEDKSGLVWIGTRQGLDSFNKKTGLFTNYNKSLEASGIEDSCISYIYEDNLGFLWLGCEIDGGLVKYDRQSDKITNYKYDPTNNKSISNNSIKGIAEDGEGNLWIATNYGLNRFDAETEIFTRYTEDDGLSNNFVCGVLIDKFNNPWVSTNGGISKVDVIQGKIINFNVTDGLQSNEFNGYSYFKSKTGEMFFGGINGLSSFYPESLSENNYMSKVVIESFKVYDKPINLKDKIDLKYNQNYFSLDFFLSDYRNPVKTKYAYKLEGVDKNWIFSNDRNYASYTNVSDGTYTFKVKARNSSGTWSEPTSIQIVVAKPPWKTWWAYTSYCLLFLLMMCLMWNYVSIMENLIKQRTLQLNNKLQENDKLYNQLIKHERFKNNYFVNLSHELKTPLNVILSTVQLINKLNEDNLPLSKQSLHKYMKIIKRNSNSLLKIINDLIDTSKIEAGSYKVNMVEADIVYLVEEIALSMKEFIEFNKLNLIIDPEVEEKIIECDPAEIERCVVNLISNAVKFTPEEGTIWISLYDKDNTVDISVKDNGIGIPREYHEKIFDRFGQADNMSNNKLGSGIGLTLVKSLVEIHGGKISLISDLNKGSEFIITLPVKHNNLHKDK
ncbi:hybrid sensor histidine kinase/response regulator [Clostridium polyendosporum]|uniref:histidine kinase n=1 Tax=Clostridium polyendosporum TaxID=69208 RepID=A0A919RYB8_9CLOT|nr:sensor histidine kinase [Clostridium polyendosporum]GIM28522.1 hybrid sensor histidine kinase/response regulator [Clostridium polyendosporum]